MLKINLLPEHIRKAGLSPIEQLHRTPLMWIAAGAMLFVAVWPLLPIAVHRRQLAQLNAKIQTLQPKKMEVDQIQRLLQQLQTQEAAFEGLKHGQSLWSKRLNVLSNVTPEGIWFSDLTLDQGKGLIIEGAAVGQGGTEMVSVGRLVQDLKASPDFSSAVKDIQIESIQRVQDHEIEIVKFTLTCALAESAAAAPKPAPR